MKTSYLVCAASFITILWLVGYSLRSTEFILAMASMHLACLSIYQCMKELGCFDE